MRWMLIGSLFLSPVALAAADTDWDNVSLSAQATVVADNDLMKSRLYLEVEGPDAARLADQANRGMTDALRTARQYPSVRVRSGNYQTTPVVHYDTERRQTITEGWRIRQDLWLESRDFKAETALAGALQPTLKVAGMQFSVSPAARQAAENTAIRRATQAFKARALLIQQGWGAHGYQLKNLSVTVDQPQPIYPRMAIAAPMAAAPATVASPEVAPGQSDMTASLSGTVHLLH